MGVLTVFCTSAHGAISNNQNRLYLLLFCSYKNIIFFQYTYISRVGPAVSNQKSIQTASRSIIFLKCYSIYRTIRYPRSFLPDVSNGAAQDASTHTPISISRTLCPILGYPSCRNICSQLLHIPDFN